MFFHEDHDFRVDIVLFTMDMPSCGTQKERFSNPFRTNRADPGLFGGRQYCFKSVKRMFLVAMVTQVRIFYQTVMERALQYLSKSIMYSMYPNKICRCYSICQ